MSLRVLLTTLLFAVSEQILESKECPKSCCLTDSMFQVQEEKCVLTSGSQRLTTLLVKEMGRNDKNVFISPHSISNILHLILLAANGQTKSDLEDAMVSHNIDIHNAAKCVSDALDQYKNRKLNITNDFFISGEYKREFDGYEAQAKYYYKADFYNCNFVGKPDKARKRVNKIVKFKTRGMIGNLFPDDGSINSGTKVVVVNTITFKDEWQNKFDKTQSYSGLFFSGPRTRRNTRFMKIDANFSREWMEMPTTDAGSLGVVAVDLPYASEEYSLLAIKYSASSQYYNNLNHIENFVSEEGILSIRSRLKSGPISLDFPRFKMEYNKDLREIFTPETGLSLILSPRADFSNFAGEGLPLYVSNIYHKAIIELTEEGTESTGASGGVWTERSSRTVSFNTPFVFYIYHKCDGLVLFQGRYVVPTD